jgi:hypothetical protein
MSAEVYGFGMTEADVAKLRGAVGPELAGMPLLTSARVAPGEVIFMNPDTASLFGKYIGAYPVVNESTTQAAPDFARRGPRVPGGEQFRHWQAAPVRTQREAFHRHLAKPVPAPEPQGTWEWLEHGALIREGKEVYYIPTGCRRWDGLAQRWAVQAIAPARGRPAYWLGVGALAAAVWAAWVCVWWALSAHL